jgi:signal transduction histidine kinase/CheY-like chemotaxis protein
MVDSSSIETSVASSLVVRPVSSASILVVEDEYLVALDIQRRLEHMGHAPIVVHSGEEAVQRAAKTRFDLVLMDIKLKGALDGIDAAQKIRSTMDIPIIYLTAYADNHTLDRARITEPYGYVLKPFQERELKAAIEMALQRHGSDRHRSEQQKLLAFLADASARMATTLDYHVVAQGAAELLVPRYGDWCQLHLVETDAAIPGFTYTRPEPRGTPKGTTDQRSVGHLIESVQRSARPEILTQIPDVTSLAQAVGAQHIRTLRDIGARSLICVPLVARDRVLGALTIVSGRSRPRYTADDLLFIEDFAHRLCSALDNALLYRQAESAIRMRDDVLAIVSHDLRTPLSTILFQAEALSRRPELGGVGQGLIRSAKRMNRLIGDLLDASAINAGRLALDRKPHRVVEIAQEALDMFRTQADARALSLGEDITAVDALVDCDRDRIVQVLANLLGNAVKFTPRGGRVTLHIDTRDHGICFEVADNGPGIPADQLPHLFDRFWRGQARNNGVGLGLYISRGIVAAHDSELRVETQLGNGSRFYFVLPRASP